MSNPADIFDLTGKAAIVTGASSGLGWHFSQVLAAAGAKVAIAARRGERLAALVERIEDGDGRAVPIVLDVTDPQSVRECIAAAETELGSISILVNNAGIAIAKPLLQQELADWERVLSTNLTGAWLMAQETARHMERQGHAGSIINIASILGIGATGQLSGYCAAKAGLVNLTRAMAIELARLGIRVNALAPGYVETDINSDFLASAAGQSMKKRIPQRRFGTPKDLDGALLLLASDASRFMTGSVLVVDGGQSAAV